MSDSDAYLHIRALLQNLTLEEAAELQRELKVLMRTLEGHSPTPSPRPPAKPSREVVEVQHVGDRIYQREWVRCGKLLCKCAGPNGELHGPYWYVYWREDGRLKSKYVGKKLKI
jgi:hypothetical protein